VGTLLPTPLVADALKDVTRVGGVVLDVFLGAGASLLAAERIGRRLRALDASPACVDVAIERWRAITGRDPVRLPRKRP
jgi:DNA modification methylase